ncbi:MAG: FecCD family ABC transporter permease [Acidiferrobacterales bacterium]
MDTTRGLVLLLTALALISIAISLSIGSVDIELSKVWSDIRSGNASTARQIVFELRLPRTLTAFAVGGLLALAGALLQVLLRNPLADPYILGVSGGAAAATLAAMLAGITGGWLTGSAFIGSLVSIVLVFGISRAGSGEARIKLLLTGIIIAAGWGALISLMLSISSSRQIYGMLFWLMGDLSYAQTPAWGLVVLLTGTALAWALARPLNLFARGEQFAASLGENPVRLRTFVYFLASLLTATAVTLAGGIGFVGLVIPHMLRLAGSNDHRWLLPQSVLLGGSFLVLADLLSRTVVAPQQLPVGVLTALIGVPLFLYLLVRSERI